MKISKELKSKGKVAFDGPKVKQRKKFAPATKKEDPKKGKGSYKRKEDAEEDEEVQLKEESCIVSFVDAIMSKNYSEAHKYLNQAVEVKFQQRVQAVINTPLF